MRKHYFYEDKRIRNRLSVEKPIAEKKVFHYFAKLKSDKKSLIKKAQKCGNVQILDSNPILPLTILIPKQISLYSGLLISVESDLELLFPAFTSMGTR